MRELFFLLLCLAPPPGRTINDAPSSTATWGVSASRTNAQPGVYPKCYEFKSPPLRMYCLLPGSKYATPFQVTMQCSEYNMIMPSTKTTDLSRSCILMKIFALEEDKFFLDRGSREYQLLEWSLCNEEAVLEGATRVPKNYTTQDAVAVCEVNHYHSNGSSCVTVEEGSNEVVHCYFREEFSARESSLRCNDLGSDIHTSLLNGKRMMNVKTLHMLTEREFWVDWTDDNIREMMGLTALNSNDSDWNSSCVTVSVIKFMPRFFKRSCSKLYPVICQFEGGTLDYSRHRCFRFALRNNFSTAAALCRREDRSLLGNALVHSRPLKLYRYIYDSTYSFCHNLLLWDGSFNQHNPGDICEAIDWYRNYSRPYACSGVLGYTCRRTNPGDLIWPPENENVYCGNLSRSDSRRRLTCMERMYLTREESVRACAKHGMSILPDRLPVNDYRTLLEDYKTHSYTSEVNSYWLKPRKSDSKKCVALIGYDNEYIQFQMNCSARLRTICVVSRENREQCRQCPKNTNCLPCVSENVLERWGNLTSFKSIQGTIDGLRDLDKDVSVAPDIQTMPNRLELILENVDTLVANVNSAERADATLKLANTTVELARKTMEKTEIWTQMDHEERVNTVAGLVKTVEDFVIKMVEFQDPSFVNSSLGNGNLTVQVMQVRGDTLEHEIELGGDSGSKVYLPPYLVPRDSKNVSVIISENLMGNGILYCTTCSSAKAPSQRPVLVTPLVTISLVVNGTRLTEIPDRVQLFLPYKNPGNMMEPKCSFIKLTELNVSVLSEDGCEVVNRTNDRIVCSCDRLATFFVLMSPMEWTEGKETEGLQWVTKIGCGISIVCLIVCVVVFTACRHLSGISNTIHRNMCLSLLTAEILFLIGMKKEDTDKVSCIVVAFFLHFLLLSTFGWMALEGCHIIALLWKVFNEGRTYYEGFYLAGYGIPLVIASITLGCQFDSYCKKDGTYCWLPSEKGIRYSFIGPVAAVIIITLGALPLVLWKKSRTRLQTERSTVEKVQHWLWRTFILLPILGVTWLLGFIMLASSDLHMAGAYLFTIFNSFQGLGMLLCYVLLKKKTRQEILRTVATITSIRKNSMSSQSSGSNPTSVTNTSRTTSSPSNPNSSWHTQQERELPLQTFDAEGKVGSSRPRKRWYELGTCE